MLKCDVATSLKGVLEVSFSHDFSKSQIAVKNMWLVALNTSVLGKKK